MNESAALLAKIGVRLGEMRAFIRDTYTKEFTQEFVATSLNLNQKTISRIETSGAGVEATERYLRLLAATRSEQGEGDYADELMVLLENIEDLRRPRSATDATAHISNIRRGTAQFLDREKTLSEVSDAFLSGTCVVALCGIDGIGKSSIANRFCQAHREQYSVTWCIDATSAVSMAEDLLDLAMALGLVSVHTSHPIEESDRALRKWLEGSGFRRPALLVFDNIANVDQIRGKIPDGTADKFLLTSGNRAWPMTVHSVEVGPLPEHFAARLLAPCIRNSTDEEIAHDVSDLVGGHPVALRVVASYVSSRRRSLSQFAATLRQEPGLALQLGTEDFAGPTLGAIAAPVKALLHRSGLQGELFRLMIFVSDIDVASLLKHKEVLPASLRQGLTDVRLREVALHALHNSCLADVWRDKISLHPLIRLIAFAAMSGEAKTKWCQIATRLVVNACSEYEDDITGIPRIWIASVIAVESRARVLSTAKHERETLAGILATYFISRGHAEAAHLYRGLSSEFDNTGTSNIPSHPAAQGSVAGASAPALWPTLAGWVVKNALFLSLLGLGASGLIIAREWFAQKQRQEMSRREKITVTMAPFRVNVTPDGCYALCTPPNSVQCADTTFGGEKYSGRVRCVRFDEPRGICWYVLSRYPCQTGVCTPSLWSSGGDATCE